MKDVIYCNNCGGNLTKDAHSLEDLCTCDCGAELREGCFLVPDPDKGFKVYFRDGNKNEL